MPASLPPNAHERLDTAIESAKHLARQQDKTLAIVQSAVGTRGTWYYRIDPTDCFLRIGEAITHTVQPNGCVTRRAALIQRPNPKE